MDVALEPQDAEGLKSATDQRRAGTDHEDDAGRRPEVTLERLAQGHHVRGQPVGVLIERVPQQQGLEEPVGDRQLPGVIKLDGVLAPHERLHHHGGGVVDVLDPPAVAVVTGQPRLDRRILVDRGDERLREKMRRPQIRALAVGEGAQHPVRDEVLLRNVVGAAEDARLELRTDGHGPTLTPSVVVMPRVRGGQRLNFADRPRRPTGWLAPAGSARLHRAVGGLRGGTRAVPVAA